MGEEALVADVDFVAGGGFDGHAELAAGERGRPRGGRAFAIAAIAIAGRVGGGWIIG